MCEKMPPRNWLTEAHSLHYQVTSATAALHTPEVGVRLRSQGVPGNEQCFKKLAAARTPTPRGDGSHRIHHTITPADVAGAGPPLPQTRPPGRQPKKCRQLQTGHDRWRRRRKIEGQQLHGVVYLPTKLMLSSSSLKGLRPAG